MTQKTIIERPRCQGKQAALADAMRTPFVKQDDGWTLFLIQGKALEWGHRFDAGIGYRVFVRFSDSAMVNAFPANEAKKLATKISRGETNEDILNLGLVMKQMAMQVEKLNKAWAAAGAPDQPLDQQEGGQA